MMIDEVDMTKFEKHMNEIWVAKTVNGLKVVDRTLGFGQLPDIKLLLEDGHWVSAKKMFIPGGPQGVAADC